MGLARVRIDKVLLAQVLDFPDHMRIREIRPSWPDQAAGYGHSLVDDSSDPYHVRQLVHLWLHGSKTVH
jgi:hypothetical protein